MLEMTNRSFFYYLFIFGHELDWFPVERDDHEVLDFSFARNRTQTSDQVEDHRLRKLELARAHRQVLVRAGRKVLESKKLIFVRQIILSIKTHLNVDFK